MVTGTRYLERTREKQYDTIDVQNFIVCISKCKLIRGHSNRIHDVNKKSLLSPGNLNILHGIRKDRRRIQIRKTQSTTTCPNFKRKRLTIKAKDNQRESVKEGDTYGGEIEVQEHIDTESIPSKMKFEGEESVVVFDLETTGISRKPDITQLAAFDGTTVFNKYISPREVISPKSSEITGLTFGFSCDQMYHHGKPKPLKAEIFRLYYWNLLILSAKRRNQFFSVITLLRLTFPY
ncbi:uncharacterized protein LOC143042917 [Mytilus galloprovincialis]|uniref:uncharacterized protein LOC143042917 n=1 Tax=Mytilus galloprovincialis TaxID=29158 RepID=UPI003F7C8DBF